MIYNELAAAVFVSIETVSYTHLDVYKRQGIMTALVTVDDGLRIERDPMVRHQLVHGFKRCV